MASNLIVNVNVHCRRTTGSTTLLPWQIAKIDPHTATFRSFFNDSIATKMVLGGYDGRNRTLFQVFIGKTKELMDLADPDLVAVEGTSTFGPYIKYYFDVDDESCETAQASGPRNAFHILLQAQATLSSRQLPNLNHNPRNGKEKLQITYFRFSQRRVLSGTVIQKLRKWVKAFFKPCQTFLVH